MESFSFAPNRAQRQAETLFRVGWMITILWVNCLRENNSKTAVHCHIPYASDTVQLVTHEYVMN
jgi:hypothetical protein